MKKPHHGMQRPRTDFWAAPRSSKLWGSRNGLAGLEFALIAPVLLSMLAGVYDLTTAYIAWERVNLCAQAIDQVATAQAANSTATNTLTNAQTTAAASSAYAYLPGTLTPAAPTFGVTVSSIVMTPTVPGCSGSACIYTPHVAWSGIFEGTAGSRRVCDVAQGTSVITQVPDTASPSPTTLPADVYSPAPLLVVDVTYTFKPLFYSFVSNITMRQSAYFSPRTGLSNNWIQYVYVAPDSTTLCAGYPSA
jgi:Flp pilus assembly protein TadG